MRQQETKSGQRESFECRVSNREKLVRLFIVNRGACTASHLP